MEPFLREDQFARLYGLLQQEPKVHIKDRARERWCREVVDWMGRSGAQWRFLSAEDGRWHSGYKRCARRGELGVRERLFQAVAGEPDLQRVLVDATVVRAHACAASAPNHRGIRRPKGSGAPGAASAPRSTSSWLRSATRASSS